MGQKRDSNPFNGPTWENCCNRDLFGHLKVKFLCQWSGQLSNMSWIRHMFYLVGNRMKYQRQTDLKASVKSTAQLWVVKPSRVWNAFIVALCGFRLKSTVTFCYLTCISGLQVSYWSQIFVRAVHANHFSVFYSICLFSSDRIYVIM